MRQVRLKRAAFLNDSYCQVGSVVSIGDDTEIEPYMALVSDAPAAAALTHAPNITPANTVTVHYNEKSGEVDIDVNGVEMKVDHAALKVQVQ